MEPTRLERTILYESPWVNLYRDRVALPGGQIIEQYHVLEFGSGSVNVIVENQAGQILMEQVSRYPTGTTSWELPAGGIEKDEQPLAAAEREVFEETGLETHSHRQIYIYHPINGISNSKVYVVYCCAGEKTGTIDEKEVRATRWFERAEIWEMIRRREITDGFALTGLLLHLNGIH